MSLSTSLRYALTELSTRNAPQHLTPEEFLFFESFIRSSETQKIRHPLYGALLFSSLYLLTPLKLANNAWDQEKMVKVKLTIISFRYR